MFGGGGNDEPNSAESHILNITAPSDTIHVRSWDELDNLTADALLGPASGMKLKTYSYECVDTINYSTLIFNIDAVVANADGRESHISKTAEWSVELVSVEYYPGIIVEPPYGNIMISYIAYLDRYRNYSDGSRIGPDRFQNYGHFASLDLRFLVHNAIGEYESIFPEYQVGHLKSDNIDIWYGNPHTGLPDSEYKNIVIGIVYLNETGIHHDWGYRIKVNRNSYIKNKDGNVMTLETLVSIDFDKDLYEERKSGNDDDLVRDFDLYTPEYVYENATDELTVFNMCKDVPILNRHDTVREVKIIDTDFGVGFHVPVEITEANVSKSGNQEYWGWYWFVPRTSYNTYYKCACGITSNFSAHMYNSNKFYCTLINIDGRIIDFVDVCKRNNKPLVKQCIRTTEGYHYHIEENTMYWGIPLQRNCDAYIDFYDGPAVLLLDDGSDPDYIEKLEKEKEEELKRQHDTENTRSMECHSTFEDKPTVHIDTHLPISFNRK